MILCEIICVSLCVCLYVHVCMSDILHPRVYVSEYESPFVIVLT